MFGTILADQKQLSPEAQKRYRASYCGLCRSLKSEYGVLSRLVLSYDMTFLILLLSSLYDPEECSCEKRCMMHPCRKHMSVTSPVSRYAAAMNVALAYYKCLDDWKDDKNLLKRLEAWILWPAAKKVMAQYPQKTAEMEKQLGLLSRLEASKKEDPDAAAGYFGALTGELFVWKEDDHWAKTLRRLGESLGRFIYLYDALMDLKEDRKKGRYNPLKGHADPENPDAFLPVLNMILGDCVQELDRLPLVEDTDILQNILYSGVWIPYYSKKAKKKER